MSDDVPPVPDQWKVAEAMEAEARRLGWRLVSRETSDDFVTVTVVRWPGREEAIRAIDDAMKRAMRAVRANEEDV